MRELLETQRRLVLSSVRDFLRDQNKTEEFIDWVAKSIREDVRAWLEDE